MSDSLPKGTDQGGPGGARDIMSESVPILLVDDMPMNLEALQAILSSSGCRFVLARSADEALLALLEQDFAAIGSFEQAPACINVLDHGEGGWIVRTVNYIPYDPLHPARTTTMEHLWSELKAWLDERA